MTNRLAAYIISELRNECSFTSVAARVNLSVSTVIRVFDLVGYSKPELPRVLSIDEFRDALAENGYRFWDWNVDSRDSVSGATASSILSAVKSQTASKTSAIILMHCKSTTAKALPNIIKYLIQSGFTIKTFDETDTPVNFYHDVR